MAVTGFAHLCIHTKDLEECGKFYCDILGFKKVFNFTKNGKLTGFYVRISKNTFMEFFQDDHDYKEKSSIAHFCLETDNIGKMKKHLAEHSVQTTEIKLGVDNTYQFWFKDPNGLDIEFHQYTGKSSQRTKKDVEIDW